MDVLEPPLCIDKFVLLNDDSFHATKSGVENMIYELEVRRKASEAESIQEVHRLIFEDFLNLTGPWGMKVIPTAPKVNRGELLAYCSLNSHFQKKVKGSITYQFRRDFTDSLTNDDRLEIDLPADTKLWNSLLSDVVPALIKSMKLYWLTLGDKLFREPRIYANGAIKIGNERACGGVLYPVFYLNVWSLKSFFKITREEAYSRLAEEVEKIELIENGIYVIGSSQMLDFGEALSLTRKMEDRLRSKKGLRLLSLFFKKNK